MVFKMSNGLWITASAAQPFTTHCHCLHLWSSNNLAQFIRFIVIFHVILVCLNVFHFYCTSMLFDFVCCVLHVIWVISLCNWYESSASLAPQENLLLVKGVLFYHSTLLSVQSFVEIQFYVNCSLKQTSHCFFIWIFYEEYKCVLYRYWLYNVLYKFY